MFDIDHFKSVNDTHGHPAGDKVIKRIASIIRQDLRKIDMAARYGGEEFAIILPQSDKDQAFQVAERIRVVVENTVFQISDDTDLKITISGGICQLNGRDIATKEELVKSTDTALYSSKYNGRNQITIFNI